VDGLRIRSERPEHRPRFSAWREAEASALLVLFPAPPRSGRSRSSVRHGRVIPTRAPLAAIHRLHRQPSALRPHRPTPGRIGIILRESASLSYVDREEPWRDVARISEAPVQKILQNFGGLSRHLWRKIQEVADRRPPRSHDPDVTPHANEISVGASPWREPRPRICLKQATLNSLPRRQRTRMFTLRLSSLAVRCQDQSKSTDLPPEGMIWYKERKDDTSRYRS
jgi:hypothetical protein